MVFDRTRARFGDDHRLCPAAQLLHDGGAEVLYYDFDTLRDIGFVQLHKPCDLPLCFRGFATRIVRDLLVDLIVGLVFREILKHIEDEPLLDRLLHGIEMESLLLPFCVHLAEQLQSGGFRRSGERKYGNIRLFAVPRDLVGDDVFDIGSRLFVYLDLTDAQRERHRRHILAGSG